VSDAKHTPGPWAWYGSTSSNSIYLATVDRGRQWVMGFKRWGFRGAQPDFSVNHIMTPASELVLFDVAKDVKGDAAAKQEGSGVYRRDFSVIDHPDARLIAAAPDLLEALKEIAKGEGAFSRDQLTHATNTIEAMKEIARAAIAKAEGKL